MTELKQKLEKEMTNNATAIAGLGISPVHLGYLKKAARIPKGHKWPLHLLTEFLTEHPDAMACGVAKKLAMDPPRSIPNRVGHSQKHRPKRDPKIKVGKRESTPDRVSVTYRLKADVYHKLQTTSELTKQSVTKIVEDIVSEFHEKYLQTREENKLQSARLAAQQAKEAYEKAQAKIDEYEQTYVASVVKPNT